jgi:protein-S-isoprenylcysteine O-methyltransferase
MSIASELGLVYLLSEWALAAFRRAKASQARAVDSGSLRLLWLVIGLSVFVAFNIPANVPTLAMEPASTFVAAGVALFVLGMALRWYSIVYLGRFFTVNVAIAADHRVIDTGPYRLIRHPSYSGALLAFVGLGLCIANWASLAVIFVPTLLVFLVRIRIEEAALTAALGETYKLYVGRTRRLIPGIY